MKRQLTIFLLLIIVTLSASVAEDDILGSWKNETKGFKIVIKKEGKIYFGTKITKDEISAKRFMNNFTFDDKEWQGGTIYVKKMDKTLDARIELKNDSTMLMTVGNFLMKKTLVFNRLKK